MDLQLNRCAMSSASSSATAIMDDRPSGERGAPGRAAPSRSGASRQRPSSVQIGCDGCGAACGRACVTHERVQGQLLVRETYQYPGGESILVHPRRADTALPASRPVPASTQPG
eukprot:364899-Chlamydomonas_euryale.AAC.12